jgi:hypothetical protein
MSEIVIKNKEQYINESGLVEDVMNKIIEWTQFYEKQDKLWLIIDEIYRHRILFEKHDLLKSCRVRGFYHNTIHDNSKMIMQMCYNGIDYERMNNKLIADQTGMIYKGSYPNLRVTNPDMKFIKLR